MKDQMRNINEKIRQYYKTFKYTKLYNRFNTPYDINPLEWGVLLLLMLTAFVCFYYLDITCTVDNSILLLKSILKGEFLNYYDFAIGKTLTVWPPNYEILMYVIFAIWNIPLAIAKKIFDIDYLYGVPAILWTKLLLLLCVIASAVIIYKICIHIGIDRKRAKVATFLFFSSTNVLLPALMISQCDIVNLFFILMGIYMLIKNKRKWFIVCFAIAIPLKMFALFIFVPLILLEEKRILKALLELAAGFSVLAVCKLISWNSVAYHYMVGSFSKQMTKSLQSVGIDLGNGTFVWFLGFLIVICIVSYMKQVSAESRNRFITYIPLAVFTALFAFFSYFPYWIILLAPFSILCIIQNSQYLKLNILLETLSGITGFICCANKYYWIYGKDSMENLLVPYLFGNGTTKFNSVADILNYVGANNIMGAIFTVFVTTLLALLVINFPRKGREINNQKIEHSVIWVRLLAIVVVMFLWLSVAFIKEDATLVDTMTGTNSAESEKSLLPEGNSVIQRFKAEDTHKLKKIALKFKNEAISHINITTLQVKIIKVDNNQTIFEEKIGTSIIEDKVTEIKANVELEKGEVYDLCLYGENDNGEMFAPLLTEDLQYKQYPVKVNGEKKKQNLFVKLYI